MSQPVRDDLTMMRSPDLWPNLVLPMKRHVSNQLETGVLLHEGRRYIWIPGANMFERIAVTDPRVQLDPDLSAILADGWVVD